MPNPKNFATHIFQKPVSSRSLTDPVPEEEETLEEVDVPTAQDMIDSLYRIMMERFDKIEELLKKDCQCPKK